MSDFSEIKDKTLQAYNRIVYAKGIKEDLGEAKALAYLNKFSPEERREMARAMAKMQRLGEPAFKRSLTTKLEGV